MLPSKGAKQSLTPKTAQESKTTQHVLCWAESGEWGGWKIHFGRNDRNGGWRLLACEVQCNPTACGHHVRLHSACYSGPNLC